MSDSEEINYGSRPDEIVRFGSHICLKHNMTGRYLTSVEGNYYENGSGQQVVFAGEWEPNHETTFIVIPRIGDDIEGEVDVNFGDVIRLKHLATRANLHSHPNIYSPVSEQQEVTCYGDDYTSDENDEWVVEQWTFDESENEEFDPEDNTWYTGRSFALRHVVTGYTFHDQLLNEDHNEVSCYGAGPDENDRWRVVF